MKNSVGRSHCAGARVKKSEGFSPNSFDRVLLNAPCSALGLRPRLFTGEVDIFLEIVLIQEKGPFRLRYLLRQYLVNFNGP